MTTPPVFKNPRDAQLANYWLRAALFDDDDAHLWLKNARVPVLKAQSESSNQAGGFLVPEILGNAILDLRDSYGLGRRFAFRPPTNSMSVRWPRSSGNIAGTWMAEGVAPAEQQATFDDVSANLKKLIITSRSSADLTEDSAFASWFVREVSKALAKNEDEALFIGDGTSTYAGIRGLRFLLLDGNHNAGKVTATSHSTFVTVDATDIGTLIGTLPARALPGAAFYVSSMGYGLMLCRLAGAAGGIAVVNGEPTFAGFPIRVTPTLTSSTGTITGQVVALFGDMSMSTLFADRRGVAIAASTQRLLDTDQVLYRAAERLDIVSHDLGDGSSAGSMCALVAG